MVRCGGRGHGAERVEVEGVVDVHGHPRLIAEPLTVTVELLSSVTAQVGAACPATCSVLSLTLWPSSLRRARAMATCMCSIVKLSPSKVSIHLPILSTALSGSIPVSGA